MHLNRPDSVAAEEPASRVLAKITFDRPAGAQSVDASGSAVDEHHGTPRLVDADGGLRVAGDTNEGYHGAVMDCSSEYFLG